jgi:RNA polymerase sigma-70 factor (ECF subfamily)
METDDELILRCGANPEAFRELVRRYQGKIYGFLVNMAGHNAVDDLFQEMWLRVFKTGARYEPRGKASSWLFQIARNVAINHLTRHGRVAGQVTEEIPEVVSDPAPEPPETMETGELKTRVKTALAKLPFDQREVFLLREMGGLSFKDIAEELDIPLGTALSRMNYALKKLRTLLGSEYA